MANAQFSSLIHAADLIPCDAKVIKDVEPSEFSISDLELISFLNQNDVKEPGLENGFGGIFISDGWELLKRSVMLRGNMGLCDGKRILTHQNEISEDFRDFFIVLPGTILLGPGGLYFPYLSWHVNKWVLRFRCLNSLWFSDYQLVRIRQS